MNILTAVLASAVVSSLVSGGTLLLSQHLERRARKEEADTAREARQRELLMSKAVEIAFEQRRVHMALAARSNQSELIAPDLVYVANIFQELQHVFETGEVTDVMKDVLTSGTTFPAAHAQSSKR